jgi:hypothetical protein
MNSHILFFGLVISLFAPFCGNSTLSKNQNSQIENVTPAISSAPKNTSEISKILIQQLIADINANENNFHLSEEDLEILNKHLKYELNDLNNDGIKEYFLYIDHNDWCGAGSNCSYWVYQKTDNGYKLHLADKVLRAKDTVTNGYRDLWSETPMGFCEPNVQRLDITAYKFDGKEYQAQERITECRAFKPRQS